jgi:hypothetical protein
MPIKPTNQWHPRTLHYRELKKNMDIVAIVYPGLHETIVKLENIMCLVFDMIDQDVSGNLTSVELLTFLCDLPTDDRDIPESSVDRIMTTNDQDHNRLLSYVEFRGMILRKLNTNNVDAALQSLQMMLHIPDKMIPIEQPLTTVHNNTIDKDNTTIFIEQSPNRVVDPSKVCESVDYPTQDTVVLGGFQEIKQWIRNILTTTPAVFCCFC